MFKLIIGSILLFVSFQVWAGSDSGTATFKSGEAGKTATTRFEYLNETTARMNIEGGESDTDSYMLFRDDKALIVANVQGQTMVMDMASLSEMASGFGASAGEQTQGFTSSIRSMESTGKSETVAGIKGELYHLKWTENGKDMEDDLVVTHDADAVGYTRAWMTVVRSIQKAGTKQEVKGDHLVARLEKEKLGILRLGDRFELVSIDSKQPDETHFVAPAATMQMPNLGSLFSGGAAGSAAATSDSANQDVVQDAAQDAAQDSAPAESSGGLWGSLKNKFKKKSDRQADRQASRTDHTVDRATDEVVDQAVGKSVNKLLQNIFK